MVQETEARDRVLVVNSETVPIEDLAKSGAKNVKVKYLIDERHGSNRFALRLYAVGKNGNTPLDKHEYEHQVYVLSGQGLLKAEGRNGPTLQLLREGDTIFIPSNAVHQFTNERDESFVFLCVKGNPALYGIKEHASTSDESTNKYC